MRMKNIEFYKRLGHQIRARRIQLGMTQQELSAKLGISYQQLHKYEAGKNDLKAHTLVLLADAFQISVAEMLAGEEKTHTRAELEFVRSYTELPDRIKLVVNELLRGLAI